MGFGIVSIALPLGSEPAPMTGGVWSDADGGANDTDQKTNGRAMLSTAGFVPLGDSGKAPKKLKKGDVIVLLDPFTMTSARGVIAQ